MASSFNNTIVVFPNVFLVCGAMNWSELLDKPILPQELHLGQVAKSFAYFGDNDRRLVAHDKARSGKKINVYKCQCCSWRVRFLKRNGAVAKDDPWYLDTWGTPALPSSQHEDGCKPILMLRQGDTLRNSLELREYLSEHRHAKKNEIVAFMLTKSIDLSRMGNGSLYKARDNILSLLRMEDEDGESNPSCGGQSAPSFGSSLHVSLASDPSTSTPVSEEMRRMATDLPDSGSSSTEASPLTPNKRHLHQSARALNKSTATRVEAASLLNAPSVSTFSASDESRQGTAVDQDAGQSNKKHSAKYRKHSMEPRRMPAHFPDRQSTETSSSSDKMLRQVASGLLLLSNAASPRVDARSLLSEPSVCTFTPSSVSMQSSDVRTKDSHTTRTGEEVKQKHGRSGNTVHSAEPPAQKVRLDSEKTKHDDSKVGVVLDSLSLLDDAISLNDGVPSSLDSTGESDEDHRRRLFLRVKSPITSVAMTDLEIVIKPRDVSREFDRTSARSVERMLSELSNPSLDANGAKSLLDELSDRVINDGKRLRERESLDHAGQAISNIVESNLKDKSVLSKVFRFTNRLYGHHDVDSIQVSNAVIPQTLKVLEQHQNDAILLYHGLLVLLTLSTRGINADDDIVKANGISLILNSMLQHSTHDGIQGRGCLLLGWLAHNDPENQRTIAAANGIRLILQSMQRQTFKEDLQCLGCYALCRLARKHEGNQRATIAANGVTVIKRAMWYFPKSLGVQIWGGDLLGCIMLGPNDDIGRNIGPSEFLSFLFQLSRPSLNVKETILLLGKLSVRAIENANQAVGLVSIKIQRNLSETDVLSPAFHFVSQWYGSQGIDLIQASNDLLERTLVERTLRALQLHKNDANCFCHGLSLLQDWTACDVRAKDVIAKANGIESILNSIRQHSSHAGIQKEGCDLLGQLANNNRKNQCTIANSSGIILILQAMQTHEQIENVQYKGCFALYCLAENHKMNQQTMFEKDGVKVIHQAIRNFPRSREIKYYGKDLMEWLQTLGNSGRMSGKRVA